MKQRWIIATTAVPEARIAGSGCFDGDPIGQYRLIQTRFHLVDHLMDALSQALQCGSDQVFHDRYTALTTLVALHDAADTPAPRYQVGRAGMFGADDPANRFLLLCEAEAYAKMWSLEDAAPYAIWDCAADEGDVEPPIVVYVGHDIVYHPKRTRDASLNMSLEGAVV